MSKQRKANPNSNVESILLPKCQTVFFPFPMSRKNTTSKTYVRKKTQLMSLNDNCNVFTVNCALRECLRPHFIAQGPILELISGVDPRGMAHIQLSQ